MRALRYINLEMNRFEGQIPSLAGLASLSELIISKNFFSAFPDDWGTLVGLRNVEASDNLFEGEYLSCLSPPYHRFSDCCYSGQIPDSFTDLYNLAQLFLHNNRKFSPFPRASQEISA